VTLASNSGQTPLTSPRAQAGSATPPPHQRHGGCAWLRPSPRGLALLAGPMILSLVVPLPLIPSATAYQVATTLNETAHAYSMGMGEVRCPSQAEWDEDWASSFGWAYTSVREDYTVLGPVVCKGALGMGSTDVPAWQQALGALVLTPEAFHLRDWGF